MLLLQVPLRDGQCDLPPFQLGMQVMTCTLVVALAGQGSVTAALKVQLQTGPPVAVQPYDETIRCSLGRDFTLPLTVGSNTRTVLGTCAWRSTYLPLPGEVLTCHSSCCRSTPFLVYML